MKYIIYFFIILFLIGSTVKAQPSEEVKKYPCLIVRCASGDKVNDSIIFTSLSELQKQIKPLQEQTDIPVLIPVTLLSYMQPEKGKLYSGIRGKKDWFIYEISNYKFCLGETDCSFLTVVGGTTSYPYTNGEPPFHYGGEEVEEHQPLFITLKNGEKAEAYESQCQIQCSKGDLVWKHNGYYYDISIASGEKKALVEMANSIIDYENKMKQKKQ